VWEPTNEVRDPVSKVWESACGVWELKGEAWDLSSHQLPLNLTPVCVLCVCKQGLSILVNTCNLGTADKYTEFADHVTCVSLKRDEAVPVVNRRSVQLYVLFRHLYAVLPDSKYADRNCAALC